MIVLKKGVQFDSKVSNSESWILKRIFDIIIVKLTLVGALTIGVNSEENK